jgi:hypothetical protein
MIVADPKRVKAAGDSFRMMSSLGDREPDQVQVLHGTAPHCSVPYCSIPNCTVLYCIRVYCIVPYRTDLHCILLYFIAQYSILLLQSKGDL